MQQSTLTFAQVTDLLEAAKIPCIVKQYLYEDGSTKYSIEFGSNWPEDLVFDTRKAFGGTIPKYVSLCSSSCGPTEIDRKTIAGGQQNYLHLSHWG